MTQETLADSMRAGVEESRRTSSSHRNLLVAATLLAYVAAGHLAVLLLGWGWAVLALAAGGAALGFAVVRREMVRYRALEDVHLSQLEAAGLLEAAEAGEPSDELLARLKETLDRTGRRIRRAAI